MVGATARVIELRQGEAATIGGLDSLLSIHQTIAYLTSVTRSSLG